MANSSPESSTGETPSLNYTFYFEMKPFRYLRIAVEALSDPDFNDHGLGRIDVDDNGFEITVESESKATASLWLSAFGMISFRITKPIIGKFVNLVLLFQSFPTYLDGDDDIVRVFHVDGSDELWFDFGTIPPCEFPADFILIEPTVGIPSTTNFCGVNVRYVPTMEQRQMIDYMLQEDDHTSKAVFVCINYKPATIKMGNRNWEYDYNDRNEFNGASKWNPGKIYWAWFEWTYTTFLRKASYLKFEFDLYFLLQPKKHIMLKFSMGEKGYLAIIKEAISMDPDNNQCT